MLNASKCYAFLALKLLILVTRVAKITYHVVFARSPVMTVIPVGLEKEKALLLEC